MPTLIEQLQLEAMDREVRISDLLRKAKLVAAKLGLKDAVAWVDHELEGYPPGVEHPEYRNLSGQPRFATQFVGWRPLQFSDAGIDSSLRSAPLRNPVSQIEALLVAEDPCIPFEGPLIATLQQITGEQILAAGMYFGPSEVSRILDAVRTRVFNWALELDAAGVRGEGLLAFSRRDREVAARVTFNISGGSFTGNVGPMSGGSVNATVQQITPDVIRALESLSDQVRALASQMGLPAEKRTEIETAAAVLKDESTQAKPDRARLHSALSTIATIAEGAAGNIIAAGILDMAPRLLAALGVS